MANTRSGRSGLESYTINGNEQMIMRGDCVHMRPEEVDRAFYVARVVKLEKDREEKVNVYVRWYYRPEDSKLGRHTFHGEKELFLSDHYDWQSANTIIGKCNVHFLADYKALEFVRDEDYFCRFGYKPFVTKGLGLSPSKVAVYCECMMPYNPDRNMVGCDACDDWFHIECIDLTVEDVDEMEEFYCRKCALQQ